MKLDEKNAFTLMEDTVSSYSKHTGWEFEKPKRWKRLSGFLWWVLIKLGAVKPIMTSVKTYRFHKKKLEELHKDVDHLLSAYDYKQIEDYVLVLGEDRFYELLDMQTVNSRDIVPSGPFYITKRYQHKLQLTGSYETIDVINHIKNIPVVFAKGVSGMALVPKITLERVK